MLVKSADQPAKRAIAGRGQPDFLRKRLDPYGIGPAYYRGSSKIDIFDRLVQLADRRVLPT